MVRFPPLVDALTKADGLRDRHTIDNIVRALREAGVLPATKVGKGAAQATVANVADMLIGVNAAVPRGQAADAVRQIRSLRRMARSSRGNGGVFKALAEAETFGEALEVLIERAPELADAFFRWVDEAYANYPDGVRDVLGLPHLEVEFDNKLRASVTMFLNRGKAPQPEFRTEYTLDVDRERSFYAGAQSDRSVTVGFGLPTLMLLHNTLFGVEEETAAGSKTGAP